MSFMPVWPQTWWDGISPSSEAWGNGPPFAPNSTTHAGLMVCSFMWQIRKCIPLKINNLTLYIFILSIRAEVCWLLLGPWKREPWRWQSLFLLPGDGGWGSGFRKVHLLPYWTAVQGERLFNHPSPAIWIKLEFSVSLNVLFYFDSEWHGGSAESGEQVDDIPQDPSDLLGTRSWWQWHIFRWAA